MRVRAFWAGARVPVCVSGGCGLVLRFLGAAVLSCFLRRLWGWGARPGVGGAVGWVSWLARFAALSLCAYLFGFALALVGERVLFFSAVHAALLVFSSWLSSCCP